MSKRKAAGALTALLAVSMLTGCTAAAGEIIRIGHNQSTGHPTHIALTAFERFIEQQLGEKYDVEVYPSELLGSQNEMVQLTQTGAIHFCVASNSLLETFSPGYSLFNLPYLFASAEAYHAAMDDEGITGPIFTSTRQAGFAAVTWIDAGARSFYTVSRPIETPADLKGLKIRTQQSPTNVEMMRLLGGSATPMGFGEVYTALQARVIDGAENNEMALTDNGHGDVCKYYSYDMHQMIPDILIGNTAFLDGLPAEDRLIFEEGFALVNTVERAEWSRAVEQAKKKAQQEQGVQFLYPDTAPFQQACAPLHHSMLEAQPELEPIYEAIQAYNALYPSSARQGGEDE
ncbi:MAG: TRAP transporter substrate-binding protein [Agathobaculum sp.]|uniref:TRAP transporter substrate-binding protein n=1 Tax=Agathobaculum sp. TaxID=2048138 RepID=UPI003D8A9FAA